MGEVARCVRVSGLVTGVGFRYAALRRAGDCRGLLRGYVRNHDTQTVECLLQGDVAEAEAMVSWLRSGPPSARVLDCEVAEMPVDAALPPFRIMF